MAGRASLLLNSLLSRPHRRDLNRLPLLRTASTRTITTRRRVSPVSTMASSDSAASPPPPPSTTITLPGGDSVTITTAVGLSESDLRNAINSFVFKQWLNNMQGERGILACGKMCLRQVHIQGVDMFGRSVGFLKFKADVFEKETGTKVPGIVFARGPAVAVLIILESGEREYVVLTEQVRVPVGKFILELPAGMIDDDKGDVVGTAVREVASIAGGRVTLYRSSDKLYNCSSSASKEQHVEEETGICLKIEDMVNLTAFLDPTTGCKVFPSPGGSDEELSLFLYRGCVEEKVITSLHGKELGLRHHGELIKVHVVPYDKLWRITADAKALSAVALYEMAKRDGLLPLRNQPGPST